MGVFPVNVSLFPHFLVCMHIKSKYLKVIHHPYMRLLIKTISLNIDSKQRFKCLSNHWLYDLCCYKTKCKFGSHNQKYDCETPFLGHIWWIKLHRLVLFWFFIRQQKKIIREGDTCDVDLGTVEETETFILTCFFTSVFRYAYVFLKTEITDLSDAPPNIIHSLSLWNILLINVCFLVYVDVFFFLRWVGREKAH